MVPQGRVSVGFDLRIGGEAQPDISYITMEYDGEFAGGDGRATASACPPKSSSSSSSSSSTKKKTTSTSSSSGSKPATSDKPQ